MILAMARASAVTFIPRVGAQDFDGLLRHATRGVDLEFNSGRKAFELPIMGLAIEDQRDDWPLRVPRFEEANFLVDVVTRGRFR